MVCWGIGGCCYYSFTFIGVPMKTQEDLYLEYARVIKMVREYNKRHVNDVKPWECVRYCGDKIVSNTHPRFIESDNYTFAIAILEGKPVFVGDVIYHTLYGNSVEITENHVGCLALDNATWTPPQKKRTFKLNGVELPCPDKDGKFCVILPSMNLCFNTADEYYKVTNHLVKLLKQARDKE